MRLPHRFVWLWLRFPTFGIVVLAAVSLCVAQGPPGGGFGPPGGGFNPDEMFQRADANRNGMIDPDEMQGRSGWFLGRMVSDAGLDSSKPIPIDRLKEVMKQRMASRGMSPSGPGGPPPSGDGRGDSRGDSNSRTPSPPPKTPAQLMAFGVEAKLNLPPGFGTPIDGPSMEELAKKYDRRTMERVDEKFRENDRNKNGILEQDEWKGLTSKSNPKDWDKDKNNILTRLEVAEYYAQYSSGGSSNNSSGGSGGPPGGGFPGAGFSGFSGGGFSGGPGGSGDRGSGDRDRGSSGGGFDKDKLQSYADSLMKQYDESGDGTLQESEWRKMKNEHHSADKNGDRLITKQELFDRLASYGRGDSGGKDGRSRGSSYGSSYQGKKSFKALTPVERLPSGLPSWFSLNDANEDGQVSMAEYASAWTDKKAAEFLRYDTNGDGIITAKECLAVEKAAASTSK